MKSVKDYRNNLAASFDRADEGESQQRKVDKLAESIRHSWQQVKMIEEGKLPRRTIQDMLDEL